MGVIWNVSLFNYLVQKMFWADNGFRFMKFMKGIQVKDTTAVAPSTDKYQDCMTRFKNNYKDRRAPCRSQGSMCWTLYWKTKVVTLTNRSQKWATMKTSNSFTQTFSLPREIDQRWKSHLWQETSKTRDKVLSLVFQWYDIRSWVGIKAETRLSQLSRKKGATRN